MTHIVFNRTAVDKALDELKILTELLKGIGFRIIKSFEQLDKARAVYSDNLISFYTLYYNTNNAIGSCRIYSISKDTLLIASTLIRKFIPEEVVNQLLLLGYEEVSNGPFLNYEVTIND